MKKLALFSVLIVALLGFSAIALAQEASVFGDHVLVRAYLVQTPDTDPATYSAYLEVRDENGVVLPTADFIVTGVLGTHNPTVDANPFMIHDNDLIKGDISISYDYLTKTIYVFCTNQTPGLHVMAYDIHLTAPDPVNGLCGTSLNSCTSGTLNDTTDSGTSYLWDCVGSDGGTTAHCSQLKPINGACGTTVNTCTAGVLNDIADSGTNYLWDCTGLNQGTTAHCSSAIPSGSADLTVTVFRTPAAGTNNLGFSGYVTVANRGTGAAGPFKIKIYMSRSTDYTAGQLLDNGTATVSGLAAGASTTVYFEGLTFHSLALHTYYRIIAVADADNQVSETNEGNNIKYYYMEVL